MILKVKRLESDAILPSYAHPGDAGLDIYSGEDLTLAPGESGKVKTGVSLEIQDGFVGLVWDKSGLSINHGIKTLGGVVDSGYRGEIMIGVINLGKESYTFEKGHKVAQMLIQKIERVEVIESDELNDTSRGVGGFGSTGK
ncbi:MAG: Deoxyuridine 5'-triphosphate nucleotidohydrolase [Parcubacteria bacterium C7867-006]|nr:MAG: Deoxyuridine 5'-triphosphate nucleotidohydrolase [Parcubacteria bacterium C7867-006]